MLKAARRQATVLWAGLTLVLFLVLSAAATGTARAEQVCLPRADAVAQLARQFDERAIGRGLSDDGQAMVELYVSDGGSWTVVVTSTAGVSCLVASGQNWSSLPLLAGRIS